MNKIKILVVEDDKSISLGLSNNLLFEGYNVTCEEDGAKALQLGLKQNFDLIILDVMLPKISGFEILKRWRQDNLDTPVLFLTAKSTEIDKIQGFEIGADDYIVKPFSLQELLARVKACLRRYHISVKRDDQGINQFRFHNIIIDFDKASLQKEDRLFKLTQKEILILKKLIQQQNKNVPRSVLMDAIWDKEEHHSLRTIDNVILSLRKKIEDFPSDPQIIKSIHGVGYQFCFIN